MIYFYSDPHFGHKNIIEYANRPFSCLEEMDTTLSFLYKTTIEPNDTVIWCGDCFMKASKSYIDEIMSSLPGKKILVAGNHDWKRLPILEPYFDLVVDEFRFTYRKKKYLVSHFPSNPQGPYDGAFAKLAPQPRNDEVVIHGHTHSKNKTSERDGVLNIHVGVDAWGFAPVSLDYLHDSL